MNITKPKQIFLAALTFVVLCSAIHCMQVSEKSNDFEALVKRGYYNFLDRVGSEIGSKLTENPTVKEQEASIVKNIESEVQQADISNKAQGESIKSKEKNLPKGVSTILSEFMGAMLEFNIKIMEDREKTEAPHSRMKKQFELYKQLTGNNHPLEEEINKQRIEVQDVPQKVVDREEIIQKSPETDQAEINNKAIMFYDSRINETIEHVKLLNNYDLTWGEMLKSLNVLEAYYTFKDNCSTSSVNISQHIIRNEYPLMLTRLSKTVLRKAMRSNPKLNQMKRNPQTGRMYINDLTAAAGYINILLDCIKEDIAESMDNYKLLQGTAHTRWEEFSRM